MAGYLLGIDNGSSRIRAVLYDFDGGEIVVETVENMPASYEPGYYQNDLELTFTKTVSVIKKITDNPVVDIGKIVAVSFTGHGNGLYLIDEYGKGSYDGIYNIDKRAKSIVDRWQEIGVSKKVQGITLQHLWAGQLPALIKWLDRNKVSVLENSRWAMLIKDYIRYRICSEVAVEETDFSGTSLFDVRNHEISDKVLEELGILKYKRLFPPIIHSYDICGGVTKDAAELTGLKEGTPVVAGLSGRSASALASGLAECSDENKHILNVYLGTWANNQYVTNKILDGVGKFMTSVHTEEGNWLVSQMSATSSRNLHWFVDSFLKGEKEDAQRQGKSIYEICDEAVASTSPSSSNVIFLPYLYDSIETTNIKGALFNIRFDDGRDIIIRGIYEGIIFAHRKNIEELLLECPRDMVIRANGGPGESSRWLQMLADVVGRPVEVMQASEERTLGASMCAGVGVGVFKDINEAIERMVHLKKRYIPNKSLKPVYDNKYNMYLEFISKFQ